MKIITVKISDEIEAQLAELFGPEYQWALEWAVENLIARPPKQQMIARDARTGLYTALELGQKYGLSPKTIESHLERAGVKLREVKE